MDYEADELRIERNNYYVQNRKRFFAYATMPQADKEDCFNFAYNMSYAKKGAHRDSRSGGMMHRTVGQIFINTFQGKMAVCSCPFAEGRRVICKHMVALYLGLFPEKEQQMMDYIEEQNQIYEQEYEQAMKEREEEIIKYVMSLSKGELREKLIRRMIDDLYY